MLIAVEHHSGWSIAVANEYATADVGVKFIESETIHAFGPPHTVIPGDATCFIETKLGEKMKQ